jgi:hypothetical protein
MVPRTWRVRFWALSRSSLERGAARSGVHGASFVPGDWKLTVNEQGTREDRPPTRREAGRRRREVRGEPGAAALGHMRLWFGLALIGLAVVVILLDQILAIGQQGTDSVARQAHRPLPGMGTPVVLDGLRLEPRYLGRQGSVGDLSAGGRRRFVLIAVEALNQNRVATTVQAGAFSLLYGAASSAKAVAYPGQEGLWGEKPLGPDARLRGILLFAVDAGVDGSILAFTPARSAGPGARWQVP